MPVTLVVSDKSGPQSGIDITSQLLAYGPLSGPNRILLAPSTSLSIILSRYTFSNTNQDTVYYATSFDHTPLPSWIHFDPSSLTFTGTAPIALSKEDTTRIYGIILSASNVVGFADAVAFFQVAVELHLFHFGSSAIFIDAPPGSAFKDASIADNLQLDGRMAELSDIESASAPTPAWLDLDPSTLQLSGSIPMDFDGMNFTVAVNDRFGDSATAMIILQSTNLDDSWLLKPIGTVNATTGTEFVYELAPKISSSRARVTVDLGTASSWLEYDESGEIIKGSVPQDLATQETIVNVTASVDSQSESQILTIVVQPGPRASTTSVRSSKSSDIGARPASGTASSQESNRNQRRRSWIAAIIVPLLVIICLLGLLICKRKRKHRGYLRNPIDSSKQFISRPITRESHDEEKLTEKYLSPRFSKPPQIPDTLLFSRSRDKRPASSVVSKRPSFLQPFNSGFLHPSRPISLSKPDPNMILEEFQEKGLTRPYRVSTQRQNRKYSKISKWHQEQSDFSLGNQGAVYSQLMRGFGHGKPDPTRADYTSTQLSRGLRSSHTIFGQGPPGFGTVRRSWRYFKNDSHSSDEWHTTSSSSNQEPRFQRTRNTIRPVTSTSTSSWQFNAPKLAHPHRVKTRMLSDTSNYRRRYRHTRSRSSSLHPPVRPESGTLRFPRVLGVLSGKSRFSRRSSVVSTDSRFQSVAPSELGSIEFEYQDDMDRYEVRPGLSIAEHRRSSPLTDLANTFRRGEPASDDRSTLLGDDERTNGSVEGEPYDVRLMARGVRLGRQIGHGHSDPTQRSLRGRIETVESFSTSKAESKRSGSISYV